MIWHPKKGQRVKVHYRKSLQPVMPCQGIEGEVVTVGTGPGPINVLIKVELWAGTGQYFYDVFPRGNLVAMNTPNHRAGKPYRPGNGTEGMYFHETFCENCRHESDENQCPILTLTLVLDTDDDDYPKQWIYDEKGRPTCTAFASHYELPADLRHKGACDDPKQMRLFA